MQYDVTEKPTEHEISLSEDDIKQAIMEWLDRNTDAVIPNGTRLWLTEHQKSRGGNEVRGRLSWTTDDVNDSA